MTDLYRELAPIPEPVWGMLEDAARDVLSTHLCGRRLVDVSEPRGWDAGAIRTGETEALSASLPARVEGRLRVVRPFVELRTECELSRAAIEAVARGAPDLACDDLEQAAKQLALAEDGLIFWGASAAHWPGMLGVDGDAGVDVEGTPFPRQVADAIETLRSRGVDGPYALALGPEPYAALAAAPTGEGGYPVLKHVERLLAGPVVRAPALRRSGVVVSLRGGDFELALGRDISLGYVSHDASNVRLCLLESLALQRADTDSAVALGGKTLSGRRSRPEEVVLSAS